MGKRRNRFTLFIKHSLLGGLTVLLPIVIVAILLHWLYTTLNNAFAPVTLLVESVFGINTYAANAALLLCLIALCFVLGNFVSTRAGDWLWQKLDGVLARRIPGYRMVRDLVEQLMGNSKNNATRRGEVATLWLYGRDNPISVMGLVTARHDDGRVTFFMPCGPNPTTGFIYHVSADLIDLCPSVRVEQLMKSVVACGFGSQPILRQSPSPRQPD